MEGQVSQGVLNLLQGINVGDRRVPTTELNDFLLSTLMLGIVGLLQENRSFKSLKQRFSQGCV